MNAPVGRSRVTLEAEAPPMLLAIDVGNTNTKLGLFADDRLHASFAVTTSRERTADEYALLVDGVLRRAEISLGDLTAVAVANVVPPIERALQELAARRLGVPYFSIDPLESPIPLAVEEPRDVGADRIVASLGALRAYGAPLIVVDLGTATRFDCVDRAGRFVGGAIAPGIQIAVDALVSRAARLSRVQLMEPPAALGRNTTTNVQSGVIFGYAALIDGMVERLKIEMGGRPCVVASGGLCPLVAGVARQIDHVDPELKLNGLRLAYEERKPC